MGLQKAQQFLAADIAVAQDLGQQARSDLFSSMDRDDGHSTISMAKHVVTSLDANNLKALASKGGHQIPARNRRKACHAAIDTR